IDLDDDFLTFAQDFADLDPIARFGLLDEVFARDFLERQETVALDAEIYETGLEARLYPSDTAFVDVRLALFSGRYLDVEIIELLAIHHGHAQLFPLSCIHQHSFHKSSVRLGLARRFGSKPQSARACACGRGHARLGTMH